MGLRFSVENSLRSSCEKEKALPKQEIIDKSTEWFASMESQNCLVNCTKYRGRFHKKHCKVIRYIENIDSLSQLDEVISDMQGCDSSLCNVASTVKSLRL